MQAKPTLNKQELEKYSSAFTLSDMEVFVFPELFYSLVLANIMSPIVWEWSKDSWFKNIEKKSFTYKVNRIKQFIMDRTVFNLDLDTWGLTTKEQEKNRFKDFVDMKTLSQSNALFGYEGDKYYFSIDIRRHFGLDKYSDEIIPYWKTETAEAMTAFALKPEHNGLAAGECVSFSALYAAAMFVIGKIPLGKIYLMATPLHSQNFIAEKEGLMTNNRRIVTKKMWFNGTELSAKARRALENEKVTIVSHITGYIHTLYKEASISEEAYKNFSESLQNFLKADFNFEIFVNFLKTQPEICPCFEYRLQALGKIFYIDMPTIFRYEQSSKNTFANESRNALLEEMDPHDFSLSPNPKALLLNDIEDFLKEYPDITIDELQKLFFDKNIKGGCFKMEHFFDDLRKFACIHPQLPKAAKKKFVPKEPLQISAEWSRKDLIEYLHGMRKKSEMAEYAFYAYRKMDEILWEPFVKAAVERNPVALQGLGNQNLEDAFLVLQKMGKDSIYQEAYRLAQPDEVWNFSTGDGLEKAFVLLNYAFHNNPTKEKCELLAKAGKATLIFGKKTFTFESSKNLKKHFVLEANGEYSEQ